MDDYCNLPQSGPDSPLLSCQAGSLRALKKTLSLLEESMAAPAIPGVMGVQMLLPEADIQERLSLPASIQSSQSRSEHTLKCIELPMKLTKVSSRQEECMEAHGSLQPSQQESDKVNRKRKRVHKKQALSPINRIEECKVQFGLPQQVASLQAEVVEVKLPNLEKMVAMQENAQDLTLSHLNNQECASLRSGLSQEAELPSPSKGRSEAVLVHSKARKKGEKKAKKEALPSNTQEEDINLHSGLLKQGVPAQVQLASRKERIAKVERAAAEVRGKLLAKGEAVTVAKVVTALLRDSNIMSLESLGLCMHDIPHLRRLAEMEERVNALILCHLAVRKITTLHDLQKDIMKAERVQKFCNLNIGHLSKHPLVVKHFSPAIGCKIHNITARTILLHLADYLDVNTDRNPSTLQVDDFVSYLVKVRSLSSSAQLCIRIESLWMYAPALVREKQAVMKLVDRVNRSKRKIIETGGLAKHVYSTQSKVIKCPKHVVYISSEGEEDVEKLAVRKEDSSTSDRPPYKRSFYPSAAEEQLRLLAKVPVKLRRQLSKCELSLQELQAVVTTWNEVCSRFSIEEVLMQMVDDGEEQETSKKEFVMLLKDCSATRILKIMRKSMKAGLWKHAFDTSEGTPSSNEMLNDGGTKNSDKEVVHANSLGQTEMEELALIKSMRLIEALGLKVDVPVVDVLNVIKMWNMNPFEPSLSQMTQLYTFLWRKVAQSETEIVAFFQQNACIFVPAKVKFFSNTCCKGQFYFVNQLTWQDNTGCLEKLLTLGDVPAVSSLRICPKTLSDLYPTLRGFLVDVCQVKPAMECYDYVNVVKMLGKLFSPIEVLPEVLAVLSKWSHDIETGQISFSARCKLMEALHSKENRILPTTQNKWVSLHRSSSLVCWCDDEVIGRQFSNLENVFYVCVSSTPSKCLAGADSNVQARQLLPFFKAMNIRPLSKVVEREPTIGFARWDKQMFDMLNWSLPYAQRYLQRWHKDTYELLQRSSFDSRLKKIQCFHTERLSFRFKLPAKLGLGTEEFEPAYLLQGDNFYGSSTKNLKSMFLEFSRVYFDGTPNIQLADFLHLIAVAFQSCTDDGKLEALLIKQGIGYRSDLGKQWLFDCASVDKSLVESGSLKHSAEELYPNKNELKQDQDRVSRGQVKNRTDDKLDGSVVDRVVICKRSLAVVMNQIEAKELESKGKQMRSSSTEKDAPVVLEEGLGPSGKKTDVVTYGDDVFVFQADGKGVKPSETVPCKDDKVERPTASPTDSALLPIRIQGECADESAPLGSVSNKDKMFLGHPPEEQALLTGRLGEAIVFNHLREKYGASHVRWMNAETERDFPYDIVVEESDGQQLHVEVKATWSANKDRLEISNREWEFAVQAGDKFIITRVFFGGLSGSAKFVWLRNPLKLCQEKRIRLALIVPS